MFDRRSHMATLLLVICAISLSGIAGCGNSRPVAQVHGKVVFKNGSMPNAGVRFIRFECEADTNAAVRKGASGTINDDGTFELYTRRPGDGVHLGKYAVTFAIYPGVMDRRSLVPAKYTTAALTPYHVVVDKDVDNLEFEIDQTGAPKLQSKK